MDRVAGTSFFMPSGLVVSGQALDIAGGGNPLLWQHLFWFLAHPEVYVLILPALGIVAEVIAVNTAKPLWGYRPMVLSALFMGFMSFLVWAHHMFLTGMGTTMSAFFQTTTIIVSIPSVVILTSLVVSLYGGSIRFPVPALFAIGFLPMFGLGGLTGLPLGLAATDIHLHDTYYVVGHFHYIVAPGTLFALFAGIYHWYPRVSGRRLNEMLGRLHFFGSFIAMNVVFFPMFVQGLAGLNRRLYDGGRTYDYAFSDGLHALNEWQFWGAVALGVFQIPFIAALILSLRKPRETDNPWNAQTLEWQAPEDAKTFEARAHRWRVEPRRDTGVTTNALGVWLFLASELMLFGGLFSAYVLLRGGADAWPDGSALLGWRAPLIATVLLAITSFRRTPPAFAVLCGVLFVAVGLMEWQYGELQAASHVFNGLFFVITGLHMLHVLGGVGALLWSRVNRNLLQYYWWLVDLVWLGILIAFYA